MRLPSGGRTNHPPLKPGPGRPKGSKNKHPIGLGEYIRERTSEGRVIVDLYMAVLRGEQLKGMRHPPSVENRLFAGGWLADRAFGRSRQPIALEGSESLSELLQLALGGHPTRSLESGRVIDLRPDDAVEKDAPDKALAERRFRP